MKTNSVQVSKEVSAEVVEEIEKEMTLEQKISGWKAQYGKLFKSVIAGDVYIWRKLKRREYVELMSDKADDDQLTGKIYERQERIASAVILYPDNMAEVIEQNAGLATTIADEVIMKSGFELSGTEEL